VSESRPIAWPALREGVDVVSADGERVGAVQHVLGDERTDIFDGIVIDTRLGPGGLRFVDAPEVAEIFEDRVVLTVGAADVERLPEPSANPAVMEHHGAEDSPSELQRKLARAWDLISGRF
jgi:uncharacterized protein YrrD